MLYFVQKVKKQRDEKGISTRLNDRLATPNNNNNNEISPNLHFLTRGGSQTFVRFTVLVNKHFCLGLKSNYFFFWNFP